VTSSPLPAGSVASSATQAALSGLPDQLEPAAESAGAELTVRDVVPRASGDSAGLAIFYAAFGLVLGGFLFGVNTYQIAPGLGFGARMGSVALLGERFAYVLPPGAGVRALAGTSYFDGGGAALGVAVLLAWIVVGTLVIFWLDRRAATSAAREKSS